jgi:hypothetical protein
MLVKKKGEAFTIKEMQEIIDTEGRKPKFEIFKLSKNGKIQQIKSHFGASQSSERYQIPRMTGSKKKHALMVIIYNSFEF